MSPHVDGAAAASTAESQRLLLHRDNKPRWKCGEIYTWNSMNLYAVECALCDDKNLCTLTEFASHMQIWHRSWECVSNDGYDDGDSEAANSEDEIEMAAQDFASENESESEDEGEEKVATDTESDGTFTGDAELTRGQQQSTEGESTATAEEQTQKSLHIQRNESIWNLPTTEDDEIAETADCTADVPTTTTALRSPNQLKIRDEIVAGQDLPQPFEEVLIIDVGAEAEPASIINQMMTKELAEIAIDDQMESEMEMNGAESEEKFELENEMENDEKSNQPTESEMPHDTKSNDTVRLESAPTQLDKSTVLSTTTSAQMCFGENLPPHNGKLTKDHMLLLIELYRAQPRLWNTAHKEFSETHLCRASWQHITQKFNSACKSNFEVNELKIRISTLCQRYLAEKRRLSDELEMNNNESPKFLHFNALRFLDEQPDNLQSRRCIFYRQNLKLIEIFKQFPILWHSAKKHKLTPVARAEALQGISETLKNFDIHLSSKSVQRRLHVLQKCYHNEKLEYLHCQNEKREFRTNFKHYVQMQFLDRHIAPYVCNTCKKIFERLQDYRIHINNESHELEEHQRKLEEIANHENDAEIIKSLEKMKVTDDTVFEQLDMEDSIKINIIDNSKAKNIVKRQPTRMTLDDISSIISNDLNNDKRYKEISMERDSTYLNAEVASKDNHMSIFLNHESTELLKFLHCNGTTVNQKNTSIVEKQSNSFDNVSSTEIERNGNLNVPQKNCTNEEQLLDITQNPNLNQRNSVNIVQDVMSNTEVLNSDLHYSMNNSLLTFNDDLQSNILADMVVTTQNSTIETESLHYVLSNSTNNFNTTQTTQDINNAQQLYSMNTADYTTTPLDYSSTASTSPMAISQNGINILHDEAYIATQYLLNITPQNNLVMPQDFLNDQLYAMNVTQQQHSVNNSPNSYIAAQDANTIHFSPSNDLRHHSLTTLKNATYAPSIENTSINPNDMEIIVEGQVMSSNALMSALNCNVTTANISAANSPYRKSDFELEMELRNAAINCSSFNPLIINNECTNDIMVKPPEIILEQDLPVLQREVEVTADLSVQQCREVIPVLQPLVHESEVTADLPVLQSAVKETTNLPVLRQRVEKVADLEGDTEEIFENNRKPITAASVKRLSEEQTHHLIRLYKEQPILWNPQHKHFESRRGRRLAWKTMTNALNKFYNIRFPWQTIYKKVCDCSKYYRKEKARAAGKKGVTSKWCYYKDFSFLDEHLDVTSDEQKTLQEKELNLKIIKIYRNYPQLWNTDTAEYKKRSQRNIHTAALHNNLREQCNVEIPLDKLRRKLIELRFAYRQEKEKRIECAQNNEAFESFYEYYKELEFLDEHISPFVCKTCGEAFTKLTDILCHYRVTKHQKIIKKRMSRKKVAAANAAEVELKNICHICGAKFTMRNNLMYHLNRHLGKRNHKCTMCPKSFYNTTALRVHERSHTKEYPYVCDECGQAFVNNSKLNQHKKRHRNQRDFKCNECGKEFFSASERDRHVKRHKKVRDTFCPICGKGFVVGSSIYSHMDLHSEVKKYVCKICEKRFAQYSGLYRHMRHSHNVVREEKKVETEQVQEN